MLLLLNPLVQTERLHILKVYLSMCELFVMCDPKGLNHT